MKLNVYAYFDNKVKAFTTPIFDQSSPDDALEGIARSIMAGKANFPYQDLTLYHLGVYDDKHGIIEGFAQPQLLEHLIAFAPRAEQEAQSHEDTED